MMQLLKQLVSKEDIQFVQASSPAETDSEVFDQDVFTASLKEGLSLFESDDW